MARFSQYPAASSTDYTDDVTFLILAPDGTVKQATLEGLNTNYLCGIHCSSLTITSAEMLALFTTPKVFGLTVPSGYYVQPLAVDFKSVYGTTPYATNISFRIRASGAATHLAAQAINYSSNIFAKMSFSTATDIQNIDGADLECYVGTGDPTAGDSDVTIYLTYRLVEI